MPATNKPTPSRPCEHTPLAALAVALLTNSFLRASAAYTARAGAAAALFTLPALLLVSGCFFRCWRLAATPFLRVFWFILLFFSSVREILRLSSFLQWVYPGTITPAFCGFLLLLPAIYLRRGNVLAQTGRILLWLLAGGGLLLFASVLPQLRLVHLQFVELTPHTVVPAVFAQLPLYPEYLLPALWPILQNEKGDGAVSFAWRLPALGISADFLVHLLSELFFGAAASARNMPLYTAACSGALSVFTRLEWLQLLLWCGAVSLKLALYFYAAALLLGDTNQPGTSKTPSLAMLFVYGGCLLFVCLFFTQSIAFPVLLCEAGMWALVALTMIGGVAAWLCQKAGHSC